MSNLPPSDIEDYALIGDCATAALVGRNGSIDWLCWPRFDSAACFAALLGGPEHGCFQIAPTAAKRPATRRYRDGTLVLETVFECEGGQVALIDFMVPSVAGGTLVRIVEGRRGVVAMRLNLALRFDYGMSVPWVTRRHGGNGIVAIAGPEMVVLRTPVPLRGEDLRTVAEFTVHEGERVPFVLTHGPSHLDPPVSPDADDALYATEEYWSAWSGRCTYDGPWAGAVKRSLLTLKCLTYAPTGGIVAAPTTSLPEALGGVRNWDYRFCWLRDATITLFAFMAAGYTDEAKSWAEWLHRSIAGSPEQVQIMYGIAGERRLAEIEIPWLPGYQGAAPVRIGNAAASQLQLDVYGEVMDALHQARSAKLLTTPQSWSLQVSMLEHLEEVWKQPDEGLWETRGGRRHFTFSKVMAWVAFDRAIKDAATHGLRAPLDRWRQVRDDIHADGLPGRLRRQARQLHPKLRRPGAGRHAAADPHRRLPAARRPAGAGHRARHRARPAGGRLRAALPHRGRRRRFAGRGGRVPRVQLLAGVGLAHAGPRHEDARGLFERLLGALQRRGAAQRGIRPPRQALHRQLPAGVQPCRAHHGRADAGRRRRRTGRSRWRQPRSSYSAGTGSAIRMRRRWRTPARRSSAR